MSQLLWPKGKLLAITSKIYRKFYPFLGNQMSKCQLELTEKSSLHCIKHIDTQHAFTVYAMTSLQKKKVWGFLSLFRTITIFSLSKMLLMTHSVVPPIKNISGS